MNAIAENTNKIKMEIKKLIKKLRSTSNFNSNIIHLAMSNLLAYLEQFLP